MEWVGHEGCPQLDLAAGCTCALEHLSGQLRTFYKAGVKIFKGRGVEL